MDGVLNKTEDKTIKASPFCYKQGMRVVLENKRQSCNPAVIKEAFSKGHFRDVDVYIVKTVMQFEVINKNALTFYLNNNKGVPQELKKPDYTRNIHNLVERGVLLRYSITDGVKSSPCLYSLSKGAYNYFSRMFGRSLFLRKREVVVDNAFPAHVLRAAASNQFFARVLVSDSFKIRKFNAGSNMNYKGYKFMLDGELKIIRGDNLLDFAVVCFRNTENCVKDACLHLEAIKKKYKDKPVSIIAVVESLKMANDIERARLLDDSLSKLAVYYIPDVFAVNEEPLSMAYMILPDKSSYDVKEVCFI